MTLPDHYTRTDLDNARTKGQIVGWLQGGGVVLGGLMLLNVVGWIPTLLVVGVAGYAGYKLLSRPSRE